MIQSRFCGLCSLIRVFWVRFGRRRTHRGHSSNSAIIAHDIVGVTVRYRVLDIIELVERVGVAVRCNFRRIFFCCSRRFLCVRKHTRRAIFTDFHRLIVEGWVAVYNVTRVVGLKLLVHLYQTCPSRAGVVILSSENTRSF